MVGEALSHLSTDPGALVATGAEITREEAASAFPEGTVVSADESTWSPDGTGVGGTIDVKVTVPGGHEAEYIAVMVNESGQWKVLATIAADAGATS